MRCLVETSRRMTSCKPTLSQIWTELLESAVEKLNLKCNAITMNNLSEVGIEMVKNGKYA